MNNQSNQNGFTLIEVLVAVGVMAIGMIGIMTVESYTILKSHESYLRTQAILQVQELADRMHANPEGVADGDYAATIPTTAPTSCISSSCSTSELAAYDLYQWNTATEAYLPNAGATITRSGLEHTIVLTWDEREDDADGVDEKSFTFVYKPIALVES